MRLPNGFGSIVFLTGNRRRPYWAKKFKYKDERGYPIYDTIGYYESYNDAYAALLEYNNSPYDLNMHDMTFAEASERWLKDFTTIPVNGRLPADATVKGYLAISRKCQDICPRKIREISVQELQMLMTTIPAGSQHTFKAYISNVFKWAVRNGIIQTSPVSYIFRTSRSDPKRHPFTAEEVREIWKMDSGPIRDTTLILLYTGMRVGELFTISEKTDRYIIAGEKTDAGRNRMIPIHSKIRPLMESVSLWRNAHQVYMAFVKIFKGHTPHDCRRAFVTRAHECGMDPLVARKIVGHAGKDVHETAYIKLQDIDYLSSQMELVEY